MREIIFLIILIILYSCPLIYYLNQVTVQSELKSTTEHRIWSTIYLSLMKVSPKLSEPVELWKAYDLYSVLYGSDVDVTERDVILLIKKSVTSIE